MNKFFRLFLLINFLLTLSIPGLAKNHNQVRYPIVLHHGLLGYGGKIGHIASYWGQIPKLLREQGAVVFVTNVSQAHSVEKRGEQLYDQLKKFGYEKYNIIGHSLGGIDARYLLKKHPHMVASITTISSPHKGSPVADFLLEQATSSTLINYSLTTFGTALGTTIGILSGHLFSQDVKGALESIRPASMTRFNRENSAGISAKKCEGGKGLYGDVRLYSWGSYGVNPLSRSDIIAKIFKKIGTLFDVDEKNDGLVALCSMKFGHYLGHKKQAHHLVPVGGVLTQMTAENSRWSERMFLDHVNRLSKVGL